MSFNSPTHTIIDPNYLVSPNFINWLRNLRILFNSKHIAYVLEGDGSNEPVSFETKLEIWEFHKWKDDNLTL